MSQLPCFPSAPETEFRTVHINQRVQGSNAETGFPVEDHKYYADNVVVTAKYTWWNFIPKNLFEQFRRIANFYFLIIVIVQFAISDRSPVSPATSLLPLAFVIFITAVKQGYEDWRRHTADREVNNRPAVIVKHGREESVYSKDLTVGDIVKVQNHEEIPCDIVVLSSSDDLGKCHIMTANLDGETNLKTRESLLETAHLSTPEQLSDLSGIIECDHPEYDMYKYNGRMHISENNTNNTYALSLTNLLLRGSKLKNTDYAYGVAVYTGRDTKMAKNQQSKNHKFSTVERSMNKFLLLFLGVLLVLTIICTVLKFQRERRHDAWYLPAANEVDAGEVVVTIFSFLVLFNYIIPISLYVTVEVQKFCGALFFNWDVELYHEPTNEPAIANTSDLNEELGQIEYVFSDKTGTLTENDMQFRQCSISSLKYVEIDDKLYKDGPSNDEPIDSSNLGSEAKQFLLALALCHTVQADEIPPKEGVDQFTKQYYYQASSPDEKALCEAAARYGVVFKGKTGDTMELQVSGEEDSYKLLHVLDFDTTRKRMSVIVQNSENKLLMFCKGADSSVLPLCTAGSEVTRRATKTHIDDYAKLGLRTLTICFKELSLEQYTDIDEQLSKAQQAIGDREEQLAKVFEDVENNFYLLGATAVEDKLQEKVKETMESLRDAGIKIWVLTGDKLETAVNISSSCGHFKNTPNSVFYVVGATTSQEIKEKLHQYNRRLLGDPNRDYALVVDGSSLAIILVDKGGDLELDFLEVGQRCNAVLCCRMSPLQKAHVVKIVKRSRARPITLAIGDGANDCSMIMEAHVGCGIMGKEGRQAVRCSDYAFHRFYYLKRVLLVHGHYFYIRLSNTVQYFFYKNVAFMLPQFLYQIWNGFSSLSLFASLFLTCYNIFFTSLPVLFYGIFEKDVKSRILYNQPSLYRESVNNQYLSWRTFLFWSLSGLWHGLVLYFGTKELYGASSFSPELLDYGFYTYGAFIFTCVVIIANLKMALLIHYWTWFMHLFVWGSILLYVLVVLIFCGFVWPWPWIKIEMDLDLDLYNIIYMLFDSAMFWLGTIMIISLCLLPDIISTVMTRFFRPTELHKAQVSETNLREYTNNKVGDVMVDNISLKSLQGNFEKDNQLLLRDLPPPKQSNGVI